MQRFARAARTVRSLQSFVNCALLRPWPSAAAPLRRSPTWPRRRASRRRPRRARSPTARWSTRTRGSACGRPPSGCTSSPTGSRARCGSGATMAVGLVVPDVGAAFYASALKSAQDVLEAAGYHVLVLNTGRARRARARGAADAARAPGRRAAGRHLRAATRRSACRPCSSTTSRHSPAPARSRWTTRPASGCSSTTWSTCTATSGSRTSGPPESLGRRAALHGTGARAARGVPRRGRARRARRCRPSTCARASRRCSRRAARAAARELMALAQPPTAIVGGTDDARHRPAARAARARACASRRTSRSSRSTSRCRPTCSTRR